MSYILTHSGQQVGLTEGCPSIEDIAVGLARAPRFAGQGRSFWSVAHHALFVADLAFATAPAGTPHWMSAPLELWALLHDAHEAVTGDVPTPFKTVALQELQRNLDRRILAGVAPGLAVDTIMRDIVKLLDRRALLVEALRVGPPGLATVDDVKCHFGRRPVPRDVETFDALEWPAIRNIEGVFLARFAQLRGLCNGRVA